MRRSTLAAKAPSSSQTAAPSVRVKVGATQVTLMPSGPHSTAQHFVRCDSAANGAFKRKRPSSLMAQANSLPSVENSRTVPPS